MAMGTRKQREKQGDIRIARRVYDSRAWVADVN